MNALELTNQAFVVHRTAAGRWSRTPTSRFLFDLAHIPGSASLRGVGFAATRTGANAVIWAYGTV